MWYSNHMDFSTKHSEDGFAYANKRPTVGQIIQVSGKSYKVTKVTTTAIAVERYYWWDRLYDRFIRRPESEDL
jgi:hypothetical protein